MKKVLIVLFAIVLMAGLTSMAIAANINGSKHDFSTGGDSLGLGQGENTGGLSTGNICSTCHVPHEAAEAAEGPLWDHDVTATTTFTPYNSPTGSLDATDVSSGTVGQVSKLCLSCHDGTVAIDSFGGATGTVTIATSDAGYVGTDLSNDHPISFTYDTALANADGELETPDANQEVNGEFPLFEGTSQMECATCHNAHDGTAGQKFLRKANTNSALCKTCHLK